jgi:hypothetical protein
LLHCVPPIFHKFIQTMARVHIEIFIDKQKALIFKKKLFEFY